MIDTAPLIKAFNEELAKATPEALLQLLGVARGVCSIPGLQCDIILRFSTNQFEDYPNGLPPRSNTLSPALQRALSAFTGEGLPVSHPVDQGHPQSAWSPQPNGPPLSGGPGTDGAPTGFEVPYDMAHRQRPSPPTVPRPTVASGEPLASLQVPLRPGMEPVNARDQTAALDGRDFIKAFSRDFIPVYAEDGVLLGCMPAFGDAVEKVYTRQLQEMDVGMLALRVVRVPYNRGINPFDIEGFQPAPGIRPGPLSTGPVGPGANRQNPDVGRGL